ncbi:MAG TPA: cytochrome c oxidase assembly protein [Gaiellaceae bacterium]|nr:cytochrome c oxidase assembly protein [Gaiellaceae bacterium]
MPGIWSAAAWQVEPPLYVAAVVTALYVIGGRKRVSARKHTPLERWRTVSFYAAVLMLLLALDSPLDVWSDDLFTAHMTQHVLLLVVVPPLAVFSAPWNRIWRGLPLAVRRPVARAVALSPRAAPLRLVGHTLVRPFVATGVFSVNLVVWHVPQLFDLTLRSEAVHDLEHTLFLGTGILLWAQLIDSPPLHARLDAPWRAAVSTVAMLAGWLVAVVLAFAPNPLYSHYADFAHRPWGLSALGDQGIAAGVMWVPGSLPFTVAIVVFFYRWLGPEPATQAATPAVGVAGNP